MTASSGALPDTALSDSAVLVTGGAGFIGANVVRSLIAGGAKRIVVLDDLSTGNASNLDGLPVEFITGSLQDAELVARCAEGVDAIVHLGAQGSVALSVDDPLLSHAVNVTGTVNVLEAARSGGDRGAPAHVILASSAAVYGPGPELPKHEAMATDPVSPYATTKVACESYGLAYQATYGVPVLAFRFFNVYGPFQPADHAYAPVIPAFIGRALQGETLQIHGDGGQTRDFVYVQTVADLIVEALARRVTAPHPVNLASGRTVTLLEVIAQLETLIGGPIERAHGAPRQGDIAHSAAAVERLRELFPNMEPIPFEEGLARTLAWWTGTA